MQLALHVGQRDVHDRDVEQQHEDADRHCHEGHPFGFHFVPPQFRCLVVHEEDAMDATNVTGAVECHIQKAGRLISDRADGLILHRPL